MNIVRFECGHIREAVSNFKEICPVYLENKPDLMDSKVVVSAHEFSGLDPYTRMYWDIMGCYR